MIEFDQYWIRVGPLNIHYYALILMTGMIVAAWMTARRAREQGYDPEHVWNGLLWAIIPGLIGARLYHVLTPSPAATVPGTSEPLTTLWYLQNPLQIFAIWNGGLGIYGAIVGGAIGIYFYVRRNKQPLLKWFDLLVPGVAIGQAIGRWGNFVNNELYGAPTNLPWGITIPYENRLPGYKQYDKFHPLFLYESLWNLAAAGVLFWIERRFRDRLRQGDLFFVYLILYAIGRFLLDFVRLDSNGFGPITTAQLVSLLAAFGAGAILIIRHRQPLPAPAALPVRNARDK